MSLLAALVAIAAAGAPGSPPQPSERCGAPKRVAKTFTFTTTDHVQLDGAMVGGGPRGVVLVHEAGRLALCGWWPYAARMATRGFRVLIFDLRCAGLSACPRSASDAVATDVQAAVSELFRRGSRSVALVGASFGGSAVLVAAAHNPRIAGVADLSGDENEVPLSATGPTTALRAARNVHQPTLIAVARHDPYVTAAEAKRVYTSLASRVKRFELLPRAAGHGWDMLESASGGWSSFEKTLTQFLHAHA
jgi:dienelactone hydrolase